LCLPNFETDTPTDLKPDNSKENEIDWTQDLKTTNSDGCLRTKSAGTE